MPWLAYKLGMLVSFIKGQIFIDLEKNSLSLPACSTCSTHEVSICSSFDSLALSKSKYEAASAEPVEWIKAKANQIEP